MAAAAQASQAKAPAAMQAMAAPPLVLRTARSGFIPPLASLSAIPARPAVQRTCEACGEEESEERSAVQPRLEVGPVGDHYEVEADEIAGRVMAMRDSDVTSAAPAVQRACSSCSSSEEEPRARRLEAREEQEEQEEKARVRRLPEESVASSEDEDRPRGRDASGESLAASEGELTSGGSPLPAGTRNYFEPRMGRDLSAVRVHQGAGAQRFNRSIGARAFTYRNHVWLGSGETAGPGFTMAHELAHVMQQTSPGPVGPEADQAMARRESGAGRIRRKSVPFWRPHEFTIPGMTNPLSPLAENSAKHDAAVNALAGANTKTITEVRIPNAVTGGTGCNICGFADFYQSDTDKVPGLELACAAPPAAAGSPGLPVPPGTPASPATPGTPGAPVPPAPVATGVKDFTSGTSSSCAKHFVKHGQRHGKKPFVHDTHRQPQMVAGSIVGSITGIQIADMKPGHNEESRKKGVSQINSYFDGLDLVRNKAKLLTGGSNIWTYHNPRLMPKASMPNIPDNWDPNKPGGDWNVNNLRLHMGPASDHAMPGVKGRWCIAKDPKNDGIWTYFLAPEPTSLAAALKTPAAPPAGFKSAKAKIDKIVGCLMATPTKRKFLCKRPLPKNELRRLPAATPARRAVRRKLPTQDNFDLAAWNAFRKGIPATGESLKTGLDRDVPKAMREKIEGQGRMVESIDWMKDSLGVQRDKPADAVAMLANKSILEKAMFWAGDTPIGDIAAVFGLLRSRLGTLYIKGAEAYLKVEKKIKAIFKSSKFKTSSGSSLGKHAAKIVGRIFLGFGKIVMARTVKIIIDCFENGIAAYIKARVEGELETLIEKAQEAEKYVEQLKEDFAAKFESQVKAAIDGYESTITAIADDVKVIAKITGAVTEIVKLARLAFCASGAAGAGWGAIITCALSAADWIASKFDASPLDWFIRQMMESCTGRELFAKALLSFRAVQTLPQTLAVAVLTELKDVLPEAAKEMMCDVKSIKVDDLKLSDYECKDGSGDGDGEGEGGGDSKGEEGGGSGPAAPPAGQEGQPPAGGVQEPPATPPATGGGGGGNVASGGEAPGQHRIKDVPLKDPTGSVKVTFYTHGIGRGFDVGKYDPPEERPIKLSLVIGRKYYVGPDPIRIKVIEVIPPSGDETHHIIRWQNLDVHTVEMPERNIELEAGRTYHGYLGKRM